MGSQFNELRNHAKLILGNNLETPVMNSSLNDITEELFVHQIELELQNVELQTAQEKLEYSCKKYTELYEFAPMAYFTIDEKGIITEVNNAGAELLGIQMHLLIGHSFSRYIAPEYMYIYSEYRKCTLGKESIQSCELKLMKRNGPLFFATLQGKILTDECEGSKLLLMVSDITAFKQDANKTTKEQTAMIERAAALNEMSATLIGELRHPLGVLTNYLTGSIRRLVAPNPDISVIQ